MTRDKNLSARLDEILQELCNTVYQHGQATKTNTPFHYGEPLSEATQAILATLRKHLPEKMNKTNSMYVEGYTDCLSEVQNMLEKK